VKTAGVFILFICLLVQVFNKWLIVFDYRLNKDFIAKNLCENKAKPKMHCNGKCQLMKKLAAEEKDAGNKHQLAAKAPLTDLFFNPSSFIFNSSAVVSLRYALYQVSLPDMPAHSIFQPPGRFV
jgi:hypothetical protein